MLRRAEGDRTEFLVVSYWESIDAVKRFAGEDYQKPVLLPRDREFLVDEPSVEPGETRGCRRSTKCTMAWRTDPATSAAAAPGLLIP